MKALLDTRTFLWWNLDDPQLSSKARAFIAEGTHEIFLSAVSTWEIAIKYANGRLELPQPPDKYVPARMLHHQFSALPIQISHTLQVQHLPNIHQDPFDRLLIVQCQIEGWPLLSGDREISQYDVTIIW